MDAGMRGQRSLARHHLDEVESCVYASRRVGHAEHRPVPEQLHETPAVPLCGLVGPALERGRDPDGRLVAALAGEARKAG